MNFIKGGKVEVSFPNGETAEMEIPDDHYMWHEAWTHRIKNIGNTDIHAIIVEEKATDDQPQLYKLYVDRTKSSIDKPRGIELAHEFRKIYEENGVKFVGVWTNINDPQEQYFMTAYKDENHYKQFLEKAGTNQKYQEMSKELAEERESIEGVNLRPATDF